MDVQAVLRELRHESGYEDQIVHIEPIPARPPRYGSLEKPLPPPLEAALREHDIFPLYTHQAQAVNHVRRGENVMVATASASGKTMCYNLPVLEAVLADPRSTALYLFPTKALAQDQHRHLKELFSSILQPADFSTFDGDTPPAARADIRQRARIVLTNPDMLHVGILPNHDSWNRLLKHLKFVVVDEAHVYRGVFGTQVAGVLRRLRRLCKQYGSTPQFILCSATISNPGEHAEKLAGLPFSVVDKDGSPHGAKQFVFWNPPLIDPAKSVRGSPNSEATGLLTALVSRNIRTLTFARTRRLTELIYRYSKEKLAKVKRGLGEKIKPYRAGYLPEQRRQIERELFDGTLTGVVATTALELGVDIGTLEATVLTGYPGSIASTWQQAGRSGRGRGESLSILIGLDNPLDQYLMRHPDFFFQKGYENAIINPQNPYILRSHLLCAAWESPLDAGDEVYFGPTYVQERDELAKQGLLRERRGRWYLSPAVSYPAQNVNIRSTSGESYSIVDTSNNTLLETIESSLAFFQVHPGAVYLHQGESYLITKLDLLAHTAFAEPVTVPYYTQARDLTDLRVTRVRQEKSCGGVKVSLGEVEVTTTVIGYKKKAQYSEEILGEEPLELPPQQFNTVAFWFDLPAPAVARIAAEQLDFPGGLHATEHAAIGILPLFALCDRNDIGGVSTPVHPDTGQAGIFIYDAYPGGIGIAEKGYELITQLWQATLKATQECPCQDGCPSCIQSPKCGNNNKPLDKKAAGILLEGLIGEVGKG